MDLTQTNPTDEALRRLIEQPCYAGQVLIVTARMLEMDPTEPMTNRAGGMAMTIAADAVLKQLPDAVRDDSLDRAAGVVSVLGEPTGITRGEYALRLRAAAKELDSGRRRRPTAEADVQARRMLGEMADRLEAHRAGQVITALGRRALIQATTMDPAIAPALRRLVPVIVWPVTRREFATQLRQIAEAM